MLAKDSHHVLQQWRLLYSWCRKLGSWLWKKKDNIGDVHGDSSCRIERRLLVFHQKNAEIPSCVTGTVTQKMANVLNPEVFLTVSTEEEDLKHDCFQTTEQVYSSRVDILDTSSWGAVDGNSFLKEGSWKAGLTGSRFSSLKTLGNRGNAWKYETPIFKCVNGRNHKEHCIKMSNLFEKLSL